MPGPKCDRAGTRRDHDRPARWCQRLRWPGKLTGVFYALILIATLRNVLGLLKVGGDAQGTVIGLLLIVSLLLSTTAQRVYRMTQIRTVLSNPGGPRSGGPLVKS